MFGKAAFDNNIELIQASQFEKQPITHIKKKVEEEKQEKTPMRISSKFKKKQGKENNLGTGERD